MTVNNSNLDHNCPVVKGLPRKDGIMDNESLFTAMGLIKMLSMMEEEVDQLKKELQKFKDCEWYFTEQEVKKIFCIIKKEVANTFAEMILTTEGSKAREEAVTVYNSVILDEAFFSLLYYSGISVSDLLMLPLDSYNPEKDEFSWRKSGNGVCINFTLNNKKILYSLRSHLQINKPKKFLFESPGGDPLPLKAVESMFECYCELAKIKNDEKWQCQALSYTGIKNFDKKIQ